MRLIWLNLEFCIGLQTVTKVTTSFLNSIRVAMNESRGVVKLSYSHADSLVGTFQGVLLGFTAKKLFPPGRLLVLGRA